jgi:protocatechuate 3,4-dioxygenase beta subunit
MPGEHTNMPIPRWSPSRRALLRAGAASTAAFLLGSCASDAAGPLSGSAPPTPRPAGEPRGTAPGAPSTGSAPPPAPTPACVETEDNHLGPFWLDGAPVRSDLAEPGLPGTRLQITGRVLGLAGAACTPLAGALLDVWQADDRGSTPARYSDARTWRLRGRLYTAEDGSYDLRTIVPGHYRDRGAFRPAHIHVRVSAPGHRRLTTQLYFDGDPYNATDRLIEAPLVMKLASTRQGQAARFDFVIRAA